MQPANKKEINERFPINIDICSVHDYSLNHLFT